MYFEMQMGNNGVSDNVDDDDGKKNTKKGIKTHILL